MLVGQKGLYSVSIDLGRRMDHCREEKWGGEEKREREEEECE